MNRLFRFVALGIAGFLYVVPAQDTGAQSNPPKREITKIAGDLYRFQNNFHFSVFLVTPDGVIATDPINADAAQWLSEQIKERFNQPIKYVIYSHDHGDHVSGGEVFKNAGAVVIAQDQAKADIIANNTATAVPDITFKDSMTVSLGGKTVELMFPGPSHSDNLIVMRFPDERTLFVVDIVTVRRLPFRNFRDGYMPGYADAIEKAAAMDFDILAPGHGPLGTKQDAIDNANYVRELAAEVQKGIDAGKSVDELKSTVMMEDYKEWGQYDQWRAENVQGMHRILTQ